MNQAWISENYLHAGHIVTAKASCPQATLESHCKHPLTHSMWSWAAGSSRSFVLWWPNRPHRILSRQTEELPGFKLLQELQMHYCSSFDEIQDPAIELLRSGSAFQFTLTKKMWLKNLIWSKQLCKLHITDPSVCANQSTVYSNYVRKTPRAL